MYNITNIFIQRIAIGRFEKIGSKWDCWIEG